MRPLSAIATILVSIICVLFLHSSVFTLTVIAWSALNATFGRLVIVQSLGFRMAQNLALLMISLGLTTSLLWRYFELHHNIYETAPGMLAGFLVYLSAKALQYQSNNKAGKRIFEYSAIGSFWT